MLMLLAATRMRIPEETANTGKRLAWRTALGIKKYPMVATEPARTVVSHPLWEVKDWLSLDRWGGVDIGSKGGRPWAAAGLGKTSR
jgi:hypothetical protein